MFRSKKDVDAHVRDVFAKCKSESERLKLCFSIAKQYASIKEFDTARRYLETYLASNPSNLAEAHKFMGDIQLELGDSEKALESFKASYSVGKTRESLSRVCDLLARGYGNQETPESRKKWFDMQKSSTGNNTLNSSSIAISNSVSPAISRRAPVSTGPPKSGFSNSSFTNGSSSPLMTPVNKTNGGGNVDLQLRYLERRFDDGLGKILDHNKIVLEEVVRLKEEMKEMAEKIDHIATTQEKLESNVKDLQEKQKSTPPPVIQYMPMPPAPVKETYSCTSCSTCRPALQEPRTEPVQPVLPVLPKSDTMKQEMDVKPKDTNVPLSQLFKKPEGSWNCGACYVSNDKVATACAACGATRPGYDGLKNEPAPAPHAAQQTFSFGFPSANTTPPQMTNFGFNSKAAVEKTEEKISNKPKQSTDSPFANLNLSGKFSFADLAKNNSPQSQGFSAGGGGGVFGGAGTPLFSNLSVSATANKSTEEKKIGGNDAHNTSVNADEGEDDFVPTAEFQPVIPLPPLVEVKKGDENENTIAEYRAKLYRFVPDTKEWKERGVGNIKLLQSKEDPKKCRVVMWREKIGKLACNFSLFPDMKIDNYQQNPKILFWACQDYAEDPSWETFTLRFGNEENCQHFKQEMLRLAKLTAPASGSPSQNQSLKGAGDASSTPVKSQTSKEENEAKPKDSNVPLSQLFKKAEGSWNCDACYVSNDKVSTACAACGTTRPGYEGVKTEPAPQITQPAFSFGFGSTNSTPSTMTNFSFNSQPTAEKTEEKISNKITDPPAAPLNLTGKFSFADLAKNNNTQGFSFGGNTGAGAFSGAGTPLFSNLSISGSANKSADEKKIGGNDATDGRNTSENADEGEDDFVPTAEFQPVIPLPPLVEVKKGDENENTIAEYRAKLYRFVSETKEWKERGVGNIKLLQSKEDPKKCRVVMWREKIGKLACNFSLFPDMKIDNYQQNPKVLCWKCQDYAEDPSWETFTLRFGNEENCQHFKQEMQRLAKLTAPASGSPSQNQSPKGAGDTSSTPVKADASKEEKDAKPKDSSVPLSQLFKKAEGSWNCGACYVSNDKDSTACAACGTTRPGYEGVKTEPAPQITQPTFSFGFQSVNSTPSTMTNFSFNNQTATEKTEEKISNKPEQSTDSPFANLNLTGKFSFADLAKNNNTQGFSFGGNSGAFSGAGTPLFSNLSTSVNQSSGDKTLGGNDAHNASENADEAEDDFVPTAEFQPVIPLPPLVEVKKGDENENTIVEYRAKIYRFVSETKEWKERGVGNLKLLQSKEDPKKCRVVMWREKIGKLACNFSLFPDIKITNYQGNPKVLFWACQDFSEDPQWQTFTARFGNEDNCEDFKKKMLQYAQGEGIPSSSTDSPVVKPENASTCSGCVGCDPDSFKMPDHPANADEALIDFPLIPDSSVEPPVPVSVSLFSSGSGKVSSSIPDNKGRTTSEDKADAKLNNSTLSNFSFSFKSPDKNESSTNPNPISFQFKSPTFSFKSPDGKSSSIFGGSIIGSSPSSTSGSAAPVVGINPSPFSSPFAQNASGLNNNASFQSPPSFNFTLPNFQQSPTQPATTTSSNEEEGEQREEDEYEDVDDEEDECMFEEDARIYIQEEAESTDSFIDKGEGVIRILYDGESYCARLVVMINGEPHTEHLVACETVLQPSGDLTYEWNGICNYENHCSKSRIKAVFKDEGVYESFSAVMQDSLEFAEQAGITEAILLEESYQ